jgi:hypothetical protein
VAAAIEDSPNVKRSKVEEMKKVAQTILDHFEGVIPNPVERFAESPLTLSLSPRGERTPELPLRVILGSLLPSGRRTG